MERFVFREDLAERHLERRIRKSMEIQRLVHFEQLCRDADAPAGTVRVLLDAMIERREVERLRPVSYTKDDMDYFQLRESQRLFSPFAWHHRRLDRRREWFDLIQLNLRPPSWTRHDYRRSLKSLT